jgi:hypothetical protein
MNNIMLSMFQEAIYTKFDVIIDAGIVELELFEVKDNGSAIEHERFSLMFKGSAEMVLPSNYIS